MSRPTVLALALAATAFAPPARADNCRNIGGSLVFGTYEPLVANASVPVDVKGSITYDCSAKAIASISLDWGLSGSGGVRYMRSATNGSVLLAYNLYTAADRMTVWGGPVTLPGPAGTPVSVDVFGRIFAGQNVDVGSYSDTVTVTLNF